MQNESELKMQISTCRPGFEFSDADHDITKKEYMQIMKEIENEFNEYYKTNTISVIQDMSYEGGFEIKDSSWPGRINAYKVFRWLKFQSWIERKKITGKILEEDERQYMDNIGNGYFNKEEWENSDVKIPCFKHEISMQNVYGNWDWSPVKKWNSMPEAQKLKKLQIIKKINEKEQKKLRHKTWLKAFDGAPKWTKHELDIIKKIFNNHGILTSKVPGKL
jgi:hypothetical protein